MKSLIQAPGGLDLLGSQINGICLQASHSFSCFLSFFLSPPRRESSRTWKKWVRREKRVSRELLVQVTWRLEIWKDKRGEGMGTT